MFAYCGNNPVNLVDCSGKYPTLFDENPYDEAVRKFGQWLGERLKEDIDRLNDDEKTDEEKALECNIFSIYKGVLVIRAPIGRMAGSFGFIVLGEKIDSTSAGEDVLKHEYGHYLHLQDIGTVHYTITVVIPSTTGATLNLFGLLNCDYYSLPWEYIADLYGGVERSTYESWTEAVAEYYWTYWGT